MTRIFQILLIISLSERLLTPVWADTEFEDLLKNYKTKIYLTKDSFMSEQYFKKTYNNYDKFKEIKNKYDPLNLINSFQSRRIGI